ncbi:MAG: class I SAM-dependent methyltransferase [Acidobacteriota bacterium]
MTNHTISRPPPRRLLKRMIGGIILLLAVVVAAAIIIEARARRLEGPRLAELLTLGEGMTVAEIGAGSGWLTVDIAERLGSSGRVYATELSASSLDEIRQAVADAGLTNVTVIEAGESTANLPPGCCDAIFMRRVYHHLGDPGAVTASLRDALTPGGRLVIIEFTATGLVGTALGMGIDQTDLVQAVTAAGFSLLRIDQWPGWDHYVAMFEKGAATAP